ncbi:MAG: hypothetical protein R2909_11505 [Gemmatimonadales bacterium]
MRKLSLLAAAVAMAACSSSGPPPAQVSPAGGPAAVAAAFMQAVADSNLAQMGALWGTERGPAASTRQPSDWVQRVTVIQAYLRGGKSRVLSESDPAISEQGRRQVMVEIDRGNCLKQVPFTMILTRDGAWLVNAIDLPAAGVPGRSCPPSGTRPPDDYFIQ